MSSPVKISLCIPTKNRYDSFLVKYLPRYVNFLKNGVIDEIVISDEDGVDYNKIYDIYKSLIDDENSNFILSKNDHVLGVFANKLKVCTLAKHKYIALIDSDNFADESYFKAGKKFIEGNILSDHTILMPARAFSNNERHLNLNFNNYCNVKYTRENAAFNISDGKNYCLMLNTGNYILSSSICKLIKHDENILSKISSCDVIFYLLLALQQIDDLEYHVVPNMNYLHMIHNDSEYLKTHVNCDDTLYNYIFPEFKKIK
jgi:hypothetical protein